MATLRDEIGQSFDMLRTFAALHPDGDMEAAITETERQVREAAARVGSPPASAQGEGWRAIETIHDYDANEDPMLIFAHGLVGEATRDADGWRWAGFTRKWPRPEPTHWMPLPAAPSSAPEGPHTK